MIIKATEDTFIFCYNTDPVTNPVRISNGDPEPKKDDLWFDKNNVCRVFDGKGWKLYNV